MKMPWLMSIWRNSKSGFYRSAFRLSAEPVMKLSSASTRQPRSSRASQRCEPMNPAPPETTARGLFAANAAVGEAQGSHHRRIVDVAAVDHHRSPHELLDASHVELAELVPFRHQDERVRAGRDLVRVLQILDIGQERAGPLHRGRVVGAQLGAGREQNLRNVDAGRLA